jgi:hypothetical protein
MQGMGVVRDRADIPARTTGALVAIAFRRGVRRGLGVTAVDIGNITSLFGKFGQETMMGREMTDRIGGPRITQQRKRLAPASAEILKSPRAARARLLHPVRAPKGVKGRRVTPDVRERMRAHRPEFEPGETLGGMAG